MNKSDIETTSPKKILGVLILFNLFLRILFFNINAAEYTDGILQITLFKTPNTLWPPFYTVLSMLVKPVAGSMEAAGKVVSLLASVALLIPLFFLASRMFDRKVATYTCIFYSVSPVILRWSVRVMTDALFAALFLTAIYFFIAFIDTSNEKKNARLRMAVLFLFVSGLATLTRYQGVLLLPLALIIFIIMVRSAPRFVPVLILSNISWLLVPLWIVVRGFSHTQQIIERTAATPLSTLFAYLNNFESFVAFFPYFLTYPMAALFLVGIFYFPLERLSRRIFLVLFLFLCIAIIGIQSVFSSFQSRYLLPVIPLVLIFAGHGMSLIESRLSNRAPYVFKIILFITVVYAASFSVAVMVMQRETFGDLKEAALFVRKEVSADTPVYSNEMYKPHILCPKMQYWSQRTIDFYNGQELPDGAVLCLHSAYGGTSAMRFHLSNLAQDYELQQLGQFNARIIPLLPDVMQEPLSHQNPMAWVFRYQPQSMTTFIFKVEKREP